MTRKEMITDVIDTVRASFALNEETVDEFEEIIRYFDKDALVKLKGHFMQAPEGLEFSKVLKGAELRGLLKVKPRIIVDNEDGEFPSLMFRNDKFLHWFRGYRFQVSGTPEGQGDYGSSDTTMAHDIQFAEFLPEELRPMMAFSHVCQATNKYPDFIELLYTNVDLIDKFMIATHRAEQIQCSGFSLTKLKDLVTTITELPQSDFYHKVALCQVQPKTEYRVCFATMCFGDNFVALKRYNSHVWSLIEFPKYVEDEDAKRHFSQHYDMQGYYIRIFSRFIWVLTTLAGICMNYMYSYPLDRKTTGLIDADALAASINMAYHAGELLKSVEDFVKDLVESQPSTISDDPHEFA